MKKIAIVFLAAAIAAIASSFWFSQHGNLIQGPSALAVLKDNSVWLSVDEELWQLSQDGHLLAKRSSKSLGIKGRVDNISLHPGGDLVLTIRDQDPLYFFNPQLGKIERSLLPDWPASLKEHSSRAINIAFNDNGLLAIATGGGHTVALFDETGHFLRRTAPGLYRFTNGLWWQGDLLWTTNTNKFELIQLSSTNMDAQKTIKLDGGMHAPFPGMAIASQNQNDSTIYVEKPFATVVRFANNMIEGRVVDVFMDGSERNFTNSALMEPRAIAWQGNKLLVVDGKSFSIKQFSGDRDLLADFGDVSVRAELDALAKAKHNFEFFYRLVLYLGIALFLTGFAFAAVASQREKTALQQRVINPQSLGMSSLDSANGWKNFLFFGPVLILMSLFVWVSVDSIKLVLLVSILFYLRVALAWASTRKDWEPIVNRQALRSLSRPDLERVLEPGETVRETLMLIGLQSRWLVLTQRRVLVFSMNALDRSLKLSIDNVDITRAGLAVWRKLPWRDKLNASFVFGSARLTLQFADHSTLAGYVTSVTTAERIVSLLSLHVGRKTATPKKLSGQNNSTGNSKQWRWQLLASAIVPGLGQWMQGRRGTALIFFLIFSVYVLAVTIPVIWTLYSHHSEVSTVGAGVAIAMPILISLVSVWDSWNLRSREKVARQ